MADFGSPGQGSGWLVMNVANPSLSKHFSGELVELLDFRVFLREYSGIERRNNWWQWPAKPTDDSNKKPAWKPAKIEMVRDTRKQWLKLVDHQLETTSEECHITHNKSFRDLVLGLNPGFSRKGDDADSSEEIKVVVKKVQTKGQGPKGVRTGSDEGKVKEVGQEKGQIELEGQA